VRTVRTLRSKHGTNLGVTFRVPSMQRDGLRVESKIQIGSSNNIFEGWNDALHDDVLLLKSQRSRSSGNNGLGSGTGDGVSDGLGGRCGR